MRLPQRLQEQVFRCADQDLPKAQSAKSVRLSVSRPVTNLCVRVLGQQLANNSPAFQKSGFAIRNLRSVGFVLSGFSDVLNRHKGILLMQQSMGQSKGAR